MTAPMLLAVANAVSARHYKLQAEARGHQFKQVPAPGTNVQMFRCYNCGNDYRVYRAKTARTVEIYSECEGQCPGTQLSMHDDVPVS